ncbi:MAG: glycosyltransferase family 4 protein [Cytophagaceae bacterium]|nr:glycosyltransferase family 4 protein [Cytophagaceae bacterium]
MKIAVNTRFLIKDKLEGIGWFTFETMKYITRKHPEHKFIFLFDRPYHKDFIFDKNIKPLVIPPPARHPMLWYTWFEVSLPLIFQVHKPDLFLSPDGFMSLRTKVPTSIVIHDIAFEHYPKDLDKLALKYYKRYTPKYADKAKRIATVSEYSKEDLIKNYRIHPDKIDVVYNGADEIYEAISHNKQKETKKIYAKGCDYFIFVGAIQPRKNIVNLFKAFDQFKLRDDKDIKLMIVGRKGWSTDEIYHTYKKMQFKKDVIFTGRVSNVELKHLYGAALALTFIPYFEGFGIPIVEAQQCHCPVITSNVTSMPEVADGSALLVNPFSIDSIAEGLRKISKDEAFRNNLIHKSKENLKRFSWEKTADKLWDTILKSIEK